MRGSLPAKSLLLLEHLVRALHREAVSEHPLVAKACEREPLGSGPPVFTQYWCCDAARGAIHRSRSAWAPCAPSQPRLPDTTGEFAVKRVCLRVCCDEVALRLTNGEGSELVEVAVRRHPFSQSWRTPLAVHQLAVAWWSFPSLTWGWVTTCGSVELRACHESGCTVRHFVLCQSWCWC